MKQHDMFLDTITIDFVVDTMTSMRVDTCVIGAKSITVDIGGANEEVWTYDQPVSCMVSSLDREVTEGSAGGRAVPEIDVNIRIPLTAQIERDAQIYHAESDRTFDVLNDPNALTFGYDLVCACKDTE